MPKLKLLILFIFLYSVSFSQIPKQLTRTFGTSTPMDTYMRAGKLLGLPIATDTTLGGGLDSIGSLIVVSSGVNRGLWQRDTLSGTHKWVYIKSIINPSDWGVSADTSASVSAANRIALKACLTYAATKNLRVVWYEPGIYGFDSGFNVPTNVDLYIANGVIIMPTWAMGDSLEIMRPYPDTKIEMLGEIQMNHRLGNAVVIDGKHIYKKGNEHWIFNLRGDGILNQNGVRIIADGGGVYDSSALSYIKDWQTFAYSFDYGILATSINRGHINNDIITIGIGTCIRGISFFSDLSIDTTLNIGRASINYLTLQGNITAGKGTRSSVNLYGVSSSVFNMKLEDIKRQADSSLIWGFYSSKTTSSNKYNLDGFSPDFYHDEGYGNTTNLSRFQSSIISVIPSQVASVNPNGLIPRFAGNADDYLNGATRKPWMEVSTNSTTPDSLWRLFDNSVGGNSRVEITDADATEKTIKIAFDHGINGFEGGVEFSNIKAAPSYLRVEGHSVDSNKIYTLFETDTGWYVPSAQFSFYGKILAYKLKPIILGDTVFYNNLKRPRKFTNMDTLYITVKGNNPDGSGLIGINRIWAFVEDEDPMTVLETAGESNIAYNKIGFNNGIKLLQDTGTHYTNFNALADGLTHNISFQAKNGTVAFLSDSGFGGGGGGGTTYTFNSPMNEVATIVSIDRAVANGSTLGVAAFEAANFNSLAGVISIDTANGFYPTKYVLDTAKINLRTSIAGKLSNITGLITGGTNITLTGSGTSGSPYTINSSSGGGGTLTTLNGLTGAVQTFATGTGGTDFGITSSGTVHTFNLPLVSGTDTGKVTPALFNTWNAKQATITGAATTITASNLTVSRALVSDVSGKVAVSATTAAELGFVSGATSNIQTQIDTKISNITGLITAGANITLTGSGTSGSPYSISASGAGGGGITTLNGLTGAVQTFVTGAGGTNFGITSSGTVHTFNLPLVSGTDTGKVTPTLFNTWNAKQAAITGAATTITTSNLTASRALASDVSGKVAISATTAAELGFVSGATSNIQTQIDTKISNITGLITAGANITLTGSGTSGSPYSISASGAGGGGITTLNGLTGAVQTFATGTGGTDFGITSSGTAHTFGLPIVSGTNTGKVTPTLFNTWNAKQAAITGAATTITASNLTASRALVSNVSGKVAVSATTLAELGFVSGVTSPVQTQFSGKEQIVNYALTTLTDGATITINASGNKRNFQVTLGGNRTIALSNIQTGIWYSVKVIQDATGGRTITLPALSKVANGDGIGTAISLSVLADSIDFVFLFYDGTNYFWSTRLDFK